MQMFAKNGLTTLQLCSLQRFAKRRSAFRPSPFFLAILTVQSLPRSTDVAALGS
jgi:hypothetical protein